RRRARQHHQGRQGHPHLLARRSHRPLRRDDGSDEPDAQSGLPQGCACRPRKAAGAVMAIFVNVSRELPRWILSGFMVALAHGAVAAAFVHWRTIDDVALVVNLAPMPMSPTDTPLAVPPGPEQV